VEYKDAHRIVLGETDRYGHNTVSTGMVEVQLSVMRDGFSEKLLSFSN